MRAQQEREELAAKKEFWRLAQTMTSYVSAEYRGLAFVMPTLADLKLFAGNASRSEFVVLERTVTLLRSAGRLEEGATIVDVGAHIGTTTIPALSLYGFGRAVAVEPDPDNLRLLRANLALNGLDGRADVVAAAVSAESGRSPFARGSRDENGYYWTKGRLADEPSLSTVDVETVTLDDLVERRAIDTTNVGLLWLDCQKEEEEALTRATRFFAHRVPTVFVLRPHKLTRESALFAMLTTHYEHAVDLRRPREDKTVPWEPLFEPIERVVQLSNRKNLTDVLVL